MTQSDSLRADDAVIPSVEISNQEATNASVARATGVLALGSITSRVLGMAREIAVTGLFGASRATDAFYVATLVPRTLYDLLIGGQLNGAIIPVLSEIVTKEGQKALWQLVSVLLSLVTVVLSLLTLLLIAFDKPVVALIGSGYDAPTQALAADLLRITAPALVFLSLFAVLSGTLYALRSFTLPAFAGALFNACVVLSMILLAPPLQVITTVSSSGVTWAAGRPADSVRAAALGWLIGAVVQMASQLPGLRGARLHFTLNWRHPALRQIARLYVPVMLSLTLDALVRFFSYNFASQTGESGLSYMTWATTMIQFPQGLVATAISIAILPTLARQSTLMALPHPKGIARDGDRPFKNTLGLGLRLAITLIIPATVGLFVLASPIVRLLFERGQFTPGDTVMTALVLRLYLIGLPFAAVDLLMIYAFYAQQDTLTPALIGLVSLVVYMIVAVMLLPTYGLFALMLADSAKHLTHSSISAYLLMRRIRGLDNQNLVITTIKASLAAGAMGAVAWLTLVPLEHAIGTTSFVRQVVLIVVSGGLSVGVFITLAVLLRLEELRWLVRLLYQRLAR